MNFKTFTKKKVYEFIYYKIKPTYNKSFRKKDKTDFENLSLKEIVSKMIPKNSKNLVLIASGPSSKNVVLSETDLYFCTNNSVNLVNEYSFIYYIQDYFFSLRYLKMFFDTDKWKGTFCVVNDNGYRSNEKVFFAVHKYLSKYKRSQGEYLLSDIFDKSSSYNALFLEFNQFLKSEFDIEFRSLNSGYSLLMLIAYFSKISGLPIKIYGLDLGLGKSEYFDGSRIDNHCAFSDINKESVNNLLSKIYQNSNFQVKNYSHFASNVL
ncbi:hypothetical protein [Flavicella marina]|uniref:hypothetical protein n=1 Tax=Flavicella marina TaxID=1475951 RepID=UPI0012643AEE|nr:hypothetical protein [Flavicella marina]